MSRIEQLIEEWKKKLLDLSKRNNLLNFRTTRRGTLKIAFPDFDELYSSLTDYDAYEFICGLIKSANVRIILIDNYVDDTVLTMMDKREKGVSAKVYTKQISEQLRLDITKHNAQYPVIDVKQFAKSHDRFLIIDNRVYLVGASLKDLGKKWFAVSLMSETDPDLLLSRL